MAGESGLPGSRIAVVYGLLVLLVGGTFLEVLTDERHWPYSKYPMYARIARPTFKRPVVYGVGAGGEEVALLSEEQLHPLSSSQVRQSIRRLLRSSTSDQDLGRALLDMGRRYEDGRRNGRHHGTPLVAVRLYECFWDMSDDQKPGPPERRELLFEAAVPAAVTR